MESDEFDFLPPVYVRGFIESLSRSLGLDSESLVAEFDRDHVPTNDVLKVIQPTYDLGRRRLSLPIIGAAALVIIFVLGILNPDATSPTGADDPAEVAAASTPGGEPVEGTDASRVSEASTSRVDEPASGTEARVSDEGLSKISFSDGIASRLSSPKGPCWVEVVADGRTIFRGMMAPGAIRTFKAKGNMSLLLGLPRSAELLVNGHRLRLPALATPIRIALPNDASRYL